MTNNDPFSQPGKTVPRVVIKVGGSLLGWPGLPEQLASYLARRGAERLMLIVGGGEFADVVRRLDRMHRIGQERSHTLAIRAMELSAMVVAALVPGLVLVDRFEDLDACWVEGYTPVFLVGRFLEKEDRNAPDALPHTWDVTSDTIAAWVAERFQASELVLLKSAMPPIGLDRVTAATAGLVDPAFPEASRRLTTVSVVNLRDVEHRPVFLT